MSFCIFFFRYFMASSFTYNVVIPIECAKFVGKKFKISNKFNFSGEFVEKENSWHDFESNHSASVADDDDDLATEAGDKPSNIDYSKSVEDIIADIENTSLSLEPVANDTVDSAKSREVKFDDSVVQPQSSYRKQLKPNKQHTGLKNISSNVGAAVSPSSKMEFDQEEPESFGVVKINRPIGKFEQADDAVSTISSINSEGLTEQGYFDLKFYHNKLW